MATPRHLPMPSGLVGVASRVAHRAPPNVVRAVAVVAQARARVATPFGILERPGRRPAALLPDYRRTLKPRWAANWWPTAAVLGLRARAPLTPALAELAAALDGARTLPFPVAAAARAIVDSLSDYPDELRLAGRDDPSLGLPVVAVVARPEDVVASSALYRRYADAVVAVSAEQGVDAARARMLDVGFGSGSLTFALAGAGVGEVIGIDPEPLHYTTAGERELMRDVLAGDRADRVELLRGDVQALEFPDAYFDVVFSATALEHVKDMRAGLRETARVLRRGGIAHHGVDPWFGPAGGHALCTLDFPWGHVRLAPEEFDDYVRCWRPYEADDAAAFRRSAFQDPPLTQQEFRSAAEDAGFGVVSFRPAQLPVNDPNRLALDRRVLAECRRLHPTVQAADLLSAGYTVVLRRR